MYGLPEQPFRLTMLTSASVVALMKATPDVVAPFELYTADCVEVPSVDAAFK